MSQSFVVGSFGNGLVDIFPQRETHTDRLDGVAFLLPPSPLLISLFLFSKIYFLNLTFYCFSCWLLLMSVINFYEES